MPPRAPMSAAARWPVWQCGFRPFFLAAGVAAVGLVGAWVLHLRFGLPVPEAGGSTVLWHGHEMLLGMMVAAVLGFALTAVPEFTGTPAFGAEAVMRLAVLWGLGRLALVLPGEAAGWAALALQAALTLDFLRLVTPRLWRDPSRRHLGLWWSLLAVLAAALLAEFELARGGDLRRALYLLLHTAMALIVVTLARISMRVVNDALEARGEPADFVARPPRRQLVVVMIGLHAAAHWLVPHSAATAWLALAAAAALLGLLADWHVGAVLTRRWVWMLYALPWLIAGGYAMQGLAGLGVPIAASAGMHLQAVGAMGLAIFAVLNIAGRAHAGEHRDERPWLPVAAALLIAAALARAAAGVWMAQAPAWWTLSAALWIAAFGLWLVHAAPTLLRARRDGRWGCQGVADEAA